MFTLPGSRLLILETKPLYSATAKATIAAERGLDRICVKEFANNPICVKQMPIYFTQILGP
jgi:hypothetical protein